jgi:hypothetical protein
VKDGGGAVERELRIAQWKAERIRDGRGRGLLVDESLERSIDQIDCRYDWEEMVDGALSENIGQRGSRASRCGDKRGGRVR